MKIGRKNGRMEGKEEKEEREGLKYRLTE